MDENENNKSLDENLDSFLDSLLQDVDTNKESNEYLEELDNIKMDDPDQDILDLLNSINDGNIFDANPQDDIFSIDDSNFSQEENTDLPENLSMEPILQEEVNLSNENFSFNKEDIKSDSIDIVSDSEDTKAASKNINIDSEDIGSETTPKSIQNVGEVFSDALGAVTSLEDYNVNEDILNFAIVDEVDKNTATITPKEAITTEKAKMKEKVERTAKASPVKIQSDTNPKNIQYFSPEKKKKDGFFKRIFGNKKVERTPEEIEKLKKKAIEEVNAKVDKSEEKKKNSATAKEEKKKKAAEDAAKKKVEAAKNKELKIKAKKDAEAKKALEIQNIVEEIEENEGKINSIGASIIFVIFAAVAIVIVFGTNIYTYKLNIKNATEQFNLDRYNEAYNEVYGMQIRDEDIEIYDKIMTVMYVNKQLNSYNNYIEMEKYAEALDSLLKGLQRYDKYKELAEKLDIKTDLDNVRKKIIKELSSEYQLTEKEALEINKIEDQADYSLKVYNVVLERKDTKVSKVNK